LLLLPPQRGAGPVAAGSRQAVSTVQQSGNLLFMCQSSPEINNGFKNREE